MNGTRLPRLGARGQGWVALQAIIFALFVAAAVWGQRWPDTFRVPLFVAGAVLAGAGGLLAVAALAHLGKSLTAMPKPLDGAAMKTTGMYALARHPIYGGLILVVAGGALTNSPLALVPAAALALLFEGKRRVEERWLIGHYDDYFDYMQRVKRSFIPFVW
jgi:protein-S-isoprenylcysteine O-methyltransferase Ste14